MCALLLYSNGIIEEYKPKGNFFTEKEIVHIFSDYDRIQTERMIDVLNTWCIYGNSFQKDPLDFNKIASEINNKEIFSPVLFVHDSEINSNWKCTESILYKSYDDFINEIKKYIDDVASDILKDIEMSEQYEDKSRYFPMLETIGATPDKRVLFGFNPKEQTSDFYQNDEFYFFSKKVYDYLIKNKQENEQFTIYADKKTIIIVEPTQVVPFLNTMIEKFKSKEEYEVCIGITNIIKNWKEKTKKTRRKKSSNRNEK